MFKVRDRMEDRIYIVYRVYSKKIGESIDTYFLIYKGSEWIWVYASRYEPVLEGRPRR